MCASSTKGAVFASSSCAIAPEGEARKSRGKEAAPETSKSSCLCSCPFDTAAAWERLRQQASNLPTLSKALQPASQPALTCSDIIDADGAGHALLAVGARAPDLLAGSARGAGSKVPAGHKGNTPWLVKAHAAHVVIVFFLLGISTNTSSWCRGPRALQAIRNTG